MRAATIACERFSTAILAKMAVMWLRTVFSARLKLSGDLRVVEPARDPLEHFSLPACQPGEREGVAARRRHEGIQAVEQSREGRLARQGHVAVAVERLEARAGDRGRDEAALLERHAVVAAAVEDQRRRPHLRQLGRGVELGEGTDAAAPPRAARPRGAGSR